MSKFLVVIANIENGDTIKLSPYFFTHGGERYEIAEYEVLDSDGPFSTDNKIVEQIHLGAEGKEYQRRRETTLVEVANHSGASLRNATNRQNTGSNSQRNGNTNPTHLQLTKAHPCTCTTKPNPSVSLVNSNIPTSKANGSLPQVYPCAPNSKANQNTPKSQVDQNASDSKVYQISSESQANPSGSTPNDHEGPMDTEDSDLHSPGDYERLSGRPENATSASQPGTSSGSQADPDKNKNGNEETPSDRDVVLKQIYDHLKKWFGIQSDSKFKFEKSKDIPGAIEISFKHNYRYWMVRFPDDFPTKPAKLFYSSWEASVRSHECFDSDIVKPLNNEVDMLLTIKNICRGCKHITRVKEYFSTWCTSNSHRLELVIRDGIDGNSRSARVGRSVNDGHMLCHIGEWRSHHSLILDKPSAEDEITIRRNFPRGTSKFLVIIANIRNGDTIKLSPYFFTHSERYEITKASLTVTKKTPRNTRSNSQWNDNTCPTYSQTVSRNSHKNPRNTDSSTQRDNNTNSTTQSQATATNSSTEKAAKPTPMDTSDSLEDRPTHPTGRASYQARNNTPEGSTPQNQTSSSSPDVVTTKEIILKKIKDGLEKYFGSEGKVDIERTSHGDLQMTFKHDAKYWMLRFPETFPNQPARLSCAYNPESLSKMSPSSDYFLVKPLTNHVNVLLSITKTCYGEFCKICKNITKENLAKPAAAVPPDN
ncbi:Hypothetical predicted protein [Paramuricea clavata]|uniref:Uncharacterized protein n=1 Tax=Paramuricea clavata TaxID=317549 RepID=A0A6S7GUG7_PARCT|nr:Hypothetical predicted protein [Paramuricea clavata]